MSRAGQEPEAIVEVELGFDRFGAATIAEACRAEGLEVELVLLDRNGIAPGLFALTQHRLLVRGIDIDLVRETVDRSFPLAASTMAPASAVRRRRVALRLVAVALLVLIVGALGIQVALTI